MTTSAATVTGMVDPAGAAVSVVIPVRHEDRIRAVDGGADTGSRRRGCTFSAALAGLPAGTTIHYRAIATSDFGTLTGADQTLTTSSPPPPPPPTPGKAKAGKPRVSGTSVTDLVSCAGQTSCKVTMKLTVKETRKGHKIVSVSVAHKHKPKVTHKIVSLGTALATIPAGKSKRLRIGLNKLGRRLLKTHHHLTATLTVAQITSGQSRQITARKVRFKATKRHGGG